MSLTVSPFAVNVAPLFPAATETLTEKIAGWFPTHNNDFDSGLVASMTPAAYVVYSYLRRCCGNKSTCYPSVATISEKTGRHEKTVQRAIKELQKLGAIEAEQNGRKSYLFTLPLVVTEKRKNVRTLEKMSNELEKMSGENRKKCHPKNNSTYKQIENNNIQQTREREKAPAPVVVVAHSMNETTTAVEAETIPASTCAPKSGIPEPKSGIPEPSPLLAQLQALNVHADIASELVQTQANEVEQQLKYLPYRDAKNPAAVLVKSVKQNWEAPPAYPTPQSALQAPQRVAQPKLTPERRAHIDACRERAAQMLMPTMDERWQQQAARCEQGGQTLVEWMEASVYRTEFRALVQQLVNPC
jgi:DNA-binding transcriptional regulator YhcF (GntR family)